MCSSDLFAFLHGVDAPPNSDYSYWVSQNVFAMYQLMFAIITPALIIGAVAERMKFAAVLIFACIWMFLVYFPIAHMVWGIDGWMNGVWNPKAKVTAIDFAGGTVVHMSSGWSALVLCVLLGHRLGFRKEIMLCSCFFTAVSAIPSSTESSAYETSSRSSVRRGLSVWKSQSLPLPSHSSRSR